MDKAPTTTTTTKDENKYRTKTKSPLTSVRLKKGFFSVFAKTCSYIGFYVHEKKFKKNK